MKRFEFDAIIRNHEGMKAGYVEFPYDVRNEFNGKGRVKIKAYFDGILYRGSLVNMGGLCHVIGLRKDIQRVLGKNTGDTVHMIVEEDLDERVVEIPEDMNEALGSDKTIFEFFQKLSYSHKRDYVQWIESAKKQETRVSRLQKMIEMLKQRKLLH